MGFLKRWGRNADLRALLVLTLLATGGIRHAMAANDKEGVPDAATATLGLRGLLIPLDSANLSSRSTGVIREMKKEGDAVKKGEIVVSMEDEAEKLAVENAKAVLDVRQFEANYTRELQKKGSGSLADERTAATNLTTAKIQLEQAELAVEKKAVHSPFDGVVTRRIRSPGEATDNYLPLVSLVDLSKVYLEVYLPANRLRDVHSGQPVEVTVPDAPGRKFTGTVEYIAPVIDPASGEFRVKILLPNDDHALRSGMAAIGLLETAGADHREEEQNPKTTVSSKRLD